MGNTTKKEHTNPHPPKIRNHPILQAISQPLHPLPHGLIRHLLIHLTATTHPTLQPPHLALQLPHLLLPPAYPLPQPLPIHQQRIDPRLKLPFMQLQRRQFLLEQSQIGVGLEEGLVELRVLLAPEVRGFALVGEGAGERGELE